MADHLYRLIAHCARPPVMDMADDRAVRERLIELASQVTAWDELPSMAEAHGMAPLVYTHLNAADLHLPSPATRQLKGLTLRQRRASQARLAVLPRLLTALEKADIRCLVVKGAALAHLVYPQPALRPMADLDLLLHADDLARARAALQLIGFRFRGPASGADHKHLPPATLVEDGILIQVELHHDLFMEPGLPPFTMDDLSGSPVPVPVASGEGDLLAHTLSYEEMLWHLCNHLRLHLDLNRPLRLLWAADIHCWAERFCHQIDWRLVAHRYPLVLNLLSLIHYLSPLSEGLIEVAGLKLGREPAGIGREFQGWPRWSLAQQREKGLWRVAADSLAPPAWWLRLRYGLGTTDPLWWHRWVRHPLFIAGKVGQLFLERVGLRSPD